MATRELSAREIKDAVIAQLRAQATAWRGDSRLEGLRSSGDRYRASTLVWGAERFEALASQFALLPEAVEAVEEEAVEADEEKVEEAAEEDEPVAKPKRHRK